MASPSSSGALQHQVATELSLGHEPAEERASSTSQAETIAKGAEGADRAEVIDGALWDTSDETTETRAMGGDGTTLADTTPEPDGWQASKNATSWEMLSSRWTSTIRSTVPQQKLSEVDSVFDSHVLESSTGEALNSVDDRGLQGIQQASEEEECQQASEESHRSETTSESKTLYTTAQENNSLREAPAVAPSDGDETGKATLDDNSFAEVSDTSPASTNGSVAPENSQIGEDTCQPVDASASLPDHAQVFLSQSISVVRSQVSKHNRSEASPRARTCVSESLELANCCADAGQASEAANECIEHGRPHEEVETESKSTVEGEEVAAVSLEGEMGLASADNNASDEASSSSFTKAEGGVSTDSTSVSEATGKLVDDHASLLDCGQVFWSQSLSAVRSELTRCIKDPKANSTHTNLDADASQSQEAGTQAASSADELSDEMYEFVNAASLQTLEGEVELQARTEAVGEPSIRGSAVPSGASPTSNGATDSVPTHADHSDQAHVSATHLDDAQVFTSLAMVALRSRVAALTRPNSALGGPNSVIVG